MSRLNGVKKNGANERYSASLEPRVGFGVYDENKTPPLAWPEGMRVQLVLNYPGGHAKPETFIGTASLEPIGRDRRIGLRLDMRKRRNVFGDD